MPTKGHEYTVKRKGFHCQVTAHAHNAITDMVNAIGCTQSAFFEYIGRECAERAKGVPATELDHVDYFGFSTRDLVLGARAIDATNRDRNRGR